MDYNKEQWYIDLQKAMAGFTEDYLSQISDGKIKQLEGAKKGGITAGVITKLKKSGIHNEELRTLWASMGGYASIDRLLQWQIDNNFRVCDLERTEEWCNNISIALTGKKLSKKHKENIKSGINNYFTSLSKKERSNIYGNDARKNSAKDKRIKILNTIRTEEFTSLRLHRACNRFEYDFDLLARDKTLLKRIHKGTNQNNPSVYKKIYK